MANKVIFFDMELKDSWINKDVFSHVTSLQGDLFRQVENRLTKRIRLNGKNYFIKIHQGVGLAEVFKNWATLRQPIWGAKQELQAAIRLQQLGIDSIKPLVFGQRGFFKWKQQSFLITQAIEHSVSLEEYTWKWSDEPPEYRIKMNLIKHIARITRQLHQNGINHRDLYLCHFLLNTQNTEQVHLIDLHRAQIRKKNVPQRWIEKDLAGLFFSAMAIGLTWKDILRFMKYYTKSPLREVLLQLIWPRTYKRALMLYHKQFKGDDTVKNFGAPSNPLLSRHLYLRI